MEISSDMRVAVYYAPAADDPLWRAGSRWIGRDAITGALLAQPDVLGIGEVTQAARGYGFHATLRAPFRLRDGVRWGEVMERLRGLCGTSAPFPLPALRVATMDGILVLLEAARSMALRELADRVVAAFDDLRVAPGETEVARRRARGLSTAREAMLARWGYPDVFETWRFHMTLSRRLSAAEEPVFRPAAAAFLAEACAMERRVEALCLFVQPGAGQAFRLVERVYLDGG